MIIVQRYGPHARDEWNRFVRDSRNGTFLFDRAYMEYHDDRFLDHSLMLRDGNGDLLALLPANERDRTLFSHAGLTYGGLVLGPRPGAAAVLELVTRLRNYLRENGLHALRYKTIPTIYHSVPAEEDRYALFRNDARLIRRDVLSVVPRSGRIRPQERRLRGMRSALKAGIKVSESIEFGAFWNVLRENLADRHGVSPVHSLEEIELLHSRFPDSIRLFQATLDDCVLAGVVVYESACVAHVQYISASDRGRSTHALDAVFHHLLCERYADKPWFDFGISNEDDGRLLNVGLVEQKEGFGARTVIHDHYELSAG